MQLLLKPSPRNPISRLLKTRVELSEEEKRRVEEQAVAEAVKKLREEAQAKRRKLR